MKRWLIAILLLGTVATAHSNPKTQVKTQNGVYYQLEPRDLKAQLVKKDFVLINVHTPYQGEIAGTDALIAFDTISSAKNLPKNKNAEIVIYCRSGRMSQIAAVQLVKMGYTNLRELRGGFNAWVAAGYKLEQGKR